MQRKEAVKSIKPRDASALRAGLVVARFYGDITSAMEKGAREILRKWCIPEHNIKIARTYGSFELPLAAYRLVKRHKLDLVVAIGCIVKGETRHDEYLAHATSYGLMRLSLERNVAVGFGVITADNLKQAKARSRGKANKGSEAAIAALEAAML
ncbi:MAG: 6,7-dimethyl-8-ribityllumazine synthase [Patescibacteria group bacterium]|nr:6,7-dimethyl-8-ribityllumazine synthase [Patescibacteria group bacterium]